MAAADGEAHGAVLIVDDEPGIRDVCEEALSRAGYTVVAARDGTSALREMEQREFDAAVLDIVLPDTDGLELLGAVKQRDAETVVVLVTGFATLDTAMEAVRLGAYEYIRKPFSAGDLVRILERGLEGRRLKGRNDELLAELRQANEELVQQQDQMRERVRIATDHLTALVELGRRLSEDAGPAETLRSILLAGLQVTRARAAAVYRVQEESDRLVGLLAEGLADRDVVGVEIALDGGLLGEAVVRGMARIENDVLAGPIADDEYLGFLGVQSVLASPLVWDERVHGVVAFFDREDGDFSEESLNLVRVLSGQAARVVAALEDREGRNATPHDGEFVDLADLL